jgi:ketosteroid isomerase-like protein
MSQEDVEVVRRIYEAVNADGLKAVVEFAHPSIEVVPPAWLQDELSTVRGIEEVRRFTNLWSTMFDMNLEPVRLVDNRAGGILAFVHDRGVIKESETRLDTWWVHLWTLSAGKVLKWEVFQYEEAGVFEDVRPPEQRDGDA